MTRPRTAAEKKVTELHGMPRGKIRNQPPMMRPANKAALHRIERGGSTTRCSVVSMVDCQFRRPRSWVLRGACAVVLLRSAVLARIFVFDLLLRGGAAVTALGLWSG